MATEKTANALMTICDKKKNEVWQIKPNYLNIDMEVYFKRAIIEVFENDKLKTMAKTPAGANQIYDCLRKAIQLGVMIGGTVKQAYLVPYKDKVELIATFEGYKYIALSEPNPVLNDIEIRPVYENEAKALEIDFVNGTVKGHKAVLSGDRGKLIGVYGILKKLDDSISVEWMPIVEIERIRNQYSQSYKAFKSGKLQKNLCIWETEFDKQAIKTAGKQFLKPYAAMKEGLAMALSSIDEPEYNENVEDRVASNLSEIEVDYEIDEVQEPEHVKSKSEVNPDDDGLF